jgi:sentrin-specific protease 7
MGTAANNVHVFTTQFYSKLEDEGAEAVASWTAKKGVDIFEKKFIFIPVNKNIHWSLFVIVNPGMVENAADDLLVDDDEVLEHPFLLFMDSLKAHKMSRMRKHIQGWMNFEAKRLGKFKNLHKKDPFDSLTLPVISPKGKLAFHQLTNPIKPII